MVAGASRLRFFAALRDAGGQQPRRRRRRRLLFGRRSGSVDGFSHAGMKLSNIVAYSVPELRGLNRRQLLKIWFACAPYSPYVLYVHIILLMACWSIIFNLFLYFLETMWTDFVGLVVGLVVPTNLYFYWLFKDRREELRKFIEENWEEFRPD